MQQYSHSIRPATWPPSTYLLPIALIWLLILQKRKDTLSPKLFAFCLAVIALLFYSVSWMLPKYIDTGILDIHRPTQLPVLALLLIVIRQCWLQRNEHTLYEGMAWMSGLLFLSDVLMLFSTSPHEKYAMMAHTGKLLAYVLLHVIQMRIAAEDGLARLAAEHELRIAAAFEAKEGIFVTDPEGYIVSTNKTFSDITGYSAADAIGKKPNILRSGQHEQAFYATMWQEILQLGFWEGEIWNRRKNGELFPEHLTISAIKQADGGTSNFVATFQDISASKASEEEIKRLAFYDPLTGLPNRRLLMDRLHQALAISDRNGKHGAVLFIDLDNFKTLNDSLGHGIGDHLLQRVAMRLQTCVREGDTVARLGGDEFIIMLENLSEERLVAAAQTETISEKILSSLNRSYQLGEHEHHSTPSIGATLYHGQHTSADELLKQADIAMYQSKHAGRNTLRFFDNQMQYAVNARVIIESELHNALANRQFHLFYQIQVDSQQQPQGAEVLLR